MTTRVLTAGETDLAAKLLEEGKLVALPTETVYGLAADATNADAVHAIYEAKGRPEAKPLNVLVDGMDMVSTVCEDIPADACRLAEAFWPGPLTLILKGKGTLPSVVTAGGRTQGVRCPDHPATLAVIRALGRPLACPSANRSGATSPKSAADVLDQLSGAIDAVLDGGPCTVGVESTILDLTVTPYRILRRGGLSRERLEEVLGKQVEDGPNSLRPMKVIGITGPTGAGKTTVLNALEKLGGVVVDCDAVYHQLLRESVPMKEELRRRFDPSIFDGAGELDRKALGAVVFSDSAALADLNAITHRYVLEQTEAVLTAARSEGRRAAAVDAIALLESGLGARCDLVLAVTAPNEVRVERIMAREGISREYAQSRVAAQKTNEWFAENCDRVFYNNYPSVEAAEAAALELLRNILKEETTHE